MSEQDDRRDNPRATYGVTRTRLWTGLGTVMLAGAALSLVPHAPAAGPLGKLAKPAADALAPVQIAGEGGEGGEGGAGGEAADLGDDDVAYLTRLGLMRGHLDVGMELYRQGERAAAEPHMEHPLHELYEPMEHVLEERGAAAFEQELEALEELVEHGAPVDEVDAAYQEVLASIAGAEAGVPEAGRDAPATRFAVVVALVRAAAGEYADALGEGGEVIEAVEYQDALGFVRTARALVDATPIEGNPAVAEAVAKARVQLDQTSGLWPSAMPPPGVAGDPSLLYGAAANIEIAALKLG